MRGRASVKQGQKMRGILPLCSVPEGSRPALLTVTVSERTTLHTRVWSGHVWDAAVQASLSGQLWCAPCRSSLSGSFCSSVGAISPQDAVAAERDVMENYHLHRPQALECRLTNISKEGGGGGGTNRELMKSLKEVGSVNYLLESLLGFYLSR